MVYLPHLLALPPAIIALCATTPVLAEAESQWPHNVPRHLKYFPEDEVHAKRGLSVKQRLQNEKPIGVKKMSLDEGEMFMLDNWIFAADTPSQPQSSKRSDYDVFGNATLQALSPLRPLAQSDWLARMHIRDILLNRQFKCPDGTTSCESIGAPDVCCGSGSTCISVTGSSDAGDVGCCPSGQTCAGSVSCDTASGYTSCPGTENGGCCLPGFKCKGIGCVAEGTSTSFIQPPSTSTSTSSSTPTTSTTSFAPGTTSTPPTSTSRSAYTCSTGWFSCPASLGGGCCMNGRACATGASCLGDDSTTNPSSTRAPDAPVRPTSAAITAGGDASSDANICPTGFYVCSAYYPSGCCRVGRDCQTTGSCALPPSDTIVNTNGVVIVAPTEAVATSAGSCPQAWYSCPADAGGNCCPNGYACGEQCTATASGQSGVTDKAEPSSSSSSQASFVSGASVWGVVVSFVACGVGMIVL